MTFTWQDFAAILVVVLAIAYLVWRLGIRARTSPGCPACPGCRSTSNSGEGKPLIQIDPPSHREE
jgi:hypothetical protein